jgi:choline kinase
VRGKGCLSVSREAILKAVILCAGQGKRLLPLTKYTPKCLLSLSEDFVLLGWQLSQLAISGVREVVVITGFQAYKVERFLQSFKGKFESLKTVYNPLYKSKDNLFSARLALQEMKDDFLLINGDTLFSASSVQQLRENSYASCAMLVSTKEAYDSDDMKVSIKNGSIEAIGKNLAVEYIDAESIGVLIIRKKAISSLCDIVNKLVLEANAAQLYYLEAIARLAQVIRIEVVGIHEDAWCEVDFAADLWQARRFAARWLGCGLPSSSAYQPVEKVSYVTP